MEGRAVVSLLITLLILCLIGYVAWWALSQIPLPQPIRVVVVVIFAIIVICVLLEFLPIGGSLGWGHGPLLR